MTLAAPAVLRIGRRRHLHIDFETFSHIDVTEVGSSRYARHPSTEILMGAYAFDEAEVRQWVPAEGEMMPAEVEDALQDPEILKFAWNKPFEWNILTHVEGIRTEHAQWRDPMVLAYTLALPGSLEAATRVVELNPDQQKDTRGKALIKTFSSPRKPTKNKPWTRNTPYNSREAWEDFKRYNRQDVVAERAFWNRCKRWDLPDHEWDLWVVDQEINENGIPINLNVVKNAIAVAQAITSDRLKRMRDVTGLPNPNSGVQLLPWLQEQGYPFLDLKKGHVSRALEEAKKRIEDEIDFMENRDYTQVLEMRQEVSKASVKKFAALAVATDSDGYLRNSLQFAAAGRTWRWGGRKYQPQNLARPAAGFEEPERQIAAVQLLETWDHEMFDMVFRAPMDLLSSCVRPVVQAPSGMVLVDADLNAIENRVLGWMAKCDKILDVFRQNRDPYVDFGTYMFRETYEVMFNEYKVLKNKKRRNLAKPAVLGCGYRLGPGEQFENTQTGEIEATGLLGYAWNMGVRMTPEEAKHAVAVWRETFPEVVEFWDEIEVAAKRAVTTGRPQRCGYLAFDMSGPFLRMILPSGRALHYCRPKIKPVRTPWGAVKNQLTYEQLNDKNQWARVSTHGGKLTENADQAIARDLLAHGIMGARKRGLDIRLHVHDQNVAMCRESEANWAKAMMLEAMEENPIWAPDMPLKAECHISRYFIKD